MPDPCIALFTDQVATLQREIKYLRQHLSNPGKFPFESEGEEEAKVTSTLPTIATKFPDLPANISYNTQGALDESPLDMSNNMKQSDDNVTWQALPPN
ncbi:hypothetical protein DSO57_1011023 [Entomophthora muscae]|uniref:Uncharacterized protein n=1 Tax=Entomophthora muscae TaxID=34485 RepID=A0ACC2S8H3_9FUNG|nr:hypothetical protein DSO57_1011023 [Entomophthora muscae]